MLEQEVRRFFAYAFERETVRLRKAAGEPAPWTEDPILQAFRFCNIRREDDAVTIWFRENIRDKYFDQELVIFATVLFRWFNLVSTGEILVRENLIEDWDHNRARAALTGKQPLITGAYMVKTPLRLPKLEGIISCIEQFRALDLQTRVAMEATTLQEAWRLLQESPFLGNFMAYEIVTDLRHTKMLCRAPDILTWANAGPGAKRGLDRLNGLELETHSKRWGSMAAGAMEDMAELLNCSQKSSYWPREWESWEMREVEHTLCEFDKYMRAVSGRGRPKQRYYKGTQDARFARPERKLSTTGGTSIAPGAWRPPI